MKRLKISDLAVGFVLGFAFLLLVFLLSSDFAAHYEVCETTKEGAKECARYGVVHFALHEIGTALDSYNGLITAVATVCIAWFTLSLRQSTDRLWSAGERQIAIANASAEAAQRAAATAERALTVVERAFLLISDMNVVTMSQYGTIIDFRISVNITNSGRTPAQNYISLANLVVFEGEIPEDFRFPDRSHDDVPETGATIGPQSRIYLPIDFFIADAIDVFEKRKKALIYGWMEYNDIFPDSLRHRAEFCVEIEVYADPRQTPQVVYGKMPPILTLRAYRRYNGYDDGCIYRPGHTPVAEPDELPPATPPPVVLPPPGFQPQAFPAVGTQFQHGAIPTESAAG
jgi:hypothetical protein